MRREIAAARHRPCFGQMFGERKPLRALQQLPGRQTGVLLVKRDYAIIGGSQHEMARLQIPRMFETRR